MKQAMWMLGLAAALLSMSAWAQDSKAQHNTLPTDNGTKIRGCLSGSSGTYVLRSETDGVAYTLLGDGTALDKQIGHEIEVTGNLINPRTSKEPKNQDSEPGAPAHPAGHNFQVSSMRQLSDHCTPARPSE